MNKIQNSIIFLIVSLINNICFGQVVIDWQHCYGGSDWDSPSSVSNKNNGGFYILGSVNSTDGEVLSQHFGQQDVWLINTDSLGNIIWEKSYGGSSYESGTSVIALNDGGAIVCSFSESSDGQVLSSHGYGDAWVFKVDSLGTIVWQRAIGGSEYDLPNSMCATFDGGVIVSGTSMSADGDVVNQHGDFDAWITKIDSSGNLEWSKCYGGRSEDRANQIIQTRDSGYAFIGLVYSIDGDVTCFQSNPGIWLVKLNWNGNIEWQNCYGGSNLEEGYSLLETNDGGILFTGRTLSNDGDITGNHGGYDCWTVKTDSTGALQWQKSFGGTTDDWGMKVIKSSRNGYILVCTASSLNGDILNSHGPSDIWYAELDSLGQINWSHCFGGSNGENANDLIQIGSDHWALLGVTQSNNGDVSGNHGVLDIWFVSIKGMGTIINEIVKNKINYFPSPTSGKIIISIDESLLPATIQLFSLQGEMLQNWEIITNPTSIEFSKLNDGIYFLGNAYASFQKVVKISH